MRQHAIPQNILDVEFKLFTKFTLKEFAYLAIGIGTGGLAIYMTVSNIIPGILGIPVFIISSALGIFLGLVPINDQDADVFIKNYITAITNPTQRVWLNKEMKTQRTKPDLKPAEDGKLIPKDMKEEKKKIIGASTIIEKKEDEDVVEDILEKDLPSVPIDPNNLLITPENIAQYRFKISTTDQLPGNINMWLSTKDFKPIPNAIGYLKDTNQKVLYANRTGPNGYFLTNKTWEAETYIIEFEHPAYKFPRIQLELEDTGNKSPIKINNI